MEKENTQFNFEEIIEFRVLYPTEKGMNVLSDKVREGNKLFSLINSQI